jgi:hypothetical protein
MTPQLPEQLKFLRALKSWQGVASSADLKIEVDRRQHQARQKCRRDGLVEYQGGYWRLTYKGDAFLDEVGA